MQPSHCKNGIRQTNQIRPNESHRHRLIDFTRRDDYRYRQRCTAAQRPFRKCKKELISNNLQLNSSYRQLLRFTVNIGAAGERDGMEWQMLFLL
ncbi:hypothetical protein L596_001344 [Steinernema carpocapsae]|uniref:Uncharacterized protein n=1 Tax=Steinernema carpocapsae TaxID=34508 RepID=A0A4U8UL66_STECR|nr:hypothetical protein L596_001344 [Steinernema carpocapsae]